MLFSPISFTKVRKKEESENNEAFFKLSLKTYKLKMNRKQIKHALKFTDFGFQNKLER